MPNDLSSNYELRFWNIISLHEIQDQRPYSSSKNGEKVEEENALQRSNEFEKIKWILRSFSFCCH